MAPLLLLFVYPYHQQDISVIYTNR